LRDVTVVDTRDGALPANVGVTVADGRIAAIRPTSTVPEESATAVDASGTFVAPGYLDMHSHALDPRTPSDPG
jgi:N-acyl-D-aspartate/D-glutamate deacylase